MNSFFETARIALLLLWATGFYQLAIDSRNNRGSKGIRLLCTVMYLVFIYFFVSELRE